MVLLVLLLLLLLVAATGILLLLTKITFSVVRENTSNFVDNKLYPLGKAPHCTAPLDCIDTTNDTLVFEENMLVTATIIGGAMLKVGVDEGCELGWQVGLGEGARVGLGVGDLVGLFVGETVFFK